MAQDIAAFVAGGVLVFFLLRRSLLRWHLKTNYRQQTIPGTAGVVLVAPLLLTGNRLVIGAGVLMGLFGWLDDLYGNRHAGGFAGHIRAAFKGTVTTGLLKAFAGGLTGLAVAYLSGRRGLDMVAAAALVALAANFVNLLDLRPGRALKVWTVAAVPLSRSAAGLIGGALVFLWFDLREKVMMGDSGANLLGAAWGAAAIQSTDRTTTLILAGTLLSLNLLAEVVSFNTAIERFSVLRWVDGLGRVRPPV